MAGSSPRGASLRRQDVEEGRRDVEVLGARQVEQEDATSVRCEPTRARRKRPRGARGAGRASGPAERVRRRTPRRSVAVAGDLEGLRRAARSRPRRRSAPGSPARRGERQPRAGASTSARARRPSADRDRTTSATTFCIALTAAQSAAVEGPDEDRLDQPAVTRCWPCRSSAGRSPRRSPACISPARGSLNIFVWTKA